jgi:hypothetical protein
MAAKGKGKAAPAAPAPAPAAPAADAPPPDLGPDLDRRKPRVRAIFDTWDPERTGAIPASELPTVLRALGLAVRDADVSEKILGAMQPDGAPPMGGGGLIGSYL